MRLLPPGAPAMKFADVIHALVNRLPHDLDLEAMHAAVDEHLADKQPEAKASKPVKTTEPAPPAA